MYSIVQLFCFHADFLSSWSIYYWKWGIEVSSYYFSFSFSSFSSVSFCSLYFGAVLLDVCVFIIFLSSFLSVSVHLYSLSFLGEKRKGKKDQHIAETYSKHIAERKESIQYNQEHTLLIESPKVKGAQFSLVQEWEEGIRERTEDQAVLPSL